MHHRGISAGEKRESIFMRTRSSRPAVSKGVGFVAPVLAALAAMLVAASCGGGSASTGGSTSGGDGGTAGPGGTGSGGFGGATGSAGPGSSTSSATGTGGSGGSDVACAGDADCAGDPGGKVCDPGTGDCVECLPSSDLCAAGQFCDPIKKKCVVGCTDDTDCAMGTDIYCDTKTNACVGCLEDTNCPLGSVCVVGTCVPGCSPTQGCQMGFSCCGSNCYDLSSNADHCGTCLTPCEEPDNAAVVCADYACTMGACNPGWANCDNDASNGCEWNVLQEGPCTCTPGTTQSCYLGAPGTVNKGPCKAGTQTCDVSGTSWGACVGQVLPSSEICANNLDEDCDGIKDNVPDYDGDGWTTCNGDCCDSLFQNCGGGEPKLINPGAFEVLNNGIDDDCDAASSDAVAPAACSAAADFSGVTGTDVAKAIDLCQFTTANPAFPAKKWGVISALQRTANGLVPAAAQLSDMQNWQTAILANYGTGGILPKKGSTMAGLSTGRMRDQNDAGYVDPNSGTEFGWDGSPPAAYLAAHAGALPGSAGCSGSCPKGTGANDPVNIQLTIRVPTNAQSFSYDFRFVSAEYWDWACSNYNDFYLALLQTGAAGIPADKNISFDSKKNPVSVNNGFFEVCSKKGCYTCPSGTASLAGTGMQIASSSGGVTGGATTWLTTDAPIVPGETMQLELMIFDVTDNILDSLVLLDNFRWNLTSSAVGTHK